MNRYDMQETACTWPSPHCHCEWCKGRRSPPHNFINRMPIGARMASYQSAAHAELHDTRVPRTDRWRCGVLFRWGSVWIGAHYAPNNKRVCINLIPFVTFWITAPGGRVP